MIKRIGIAVLVLLFAGSWFMFYSAGEKAKEVERNIEGLIQSGAADEEIAGLKEERHGMEGTRILTGILLTFLSAGLLGIVFVVWLLPIFAHKITHAVYDSGEEVEPDPFHTARVLMAQGEWDDAIESFREATEADPMNRMAWVEIAKIQRTNLEDPPAAVATLRDAIEGQEWEQNDAAFLMFRLAEIYDEDLEDRAAAVTIMEQVMEQFPETRHSANARSKLHEWGMA